MVDRNAGDDRNAEDENQKAADDNGKARDHTGVAAGDGGDDAEVWCLDGVEKSNPTVHLRIRFVIVTIYIPCPNPHTLS